jgi:hypothetical protein
VAAKTSHVSFFVSRDLREALERLAVRHDRSLNAEIRQAIAPTPRPRRQSRLLPGQVALVVPAGKLPLPGHAEMA